MWTLWKHLTLLLWRACLADSPSCCPPRFTTILLPRLHFPQSSPKHWLEVAWVIMEVHSCKRRMVLKGKFGLRAVLLLFQNFLRTALHTEILLNQSFFTSPFLSALSTAVWGESFPSFSYLLPFTLHSPFSQSTSCKHGCAMSFSEDPK